MVRLKRWEFSFLRKMLAFRRRPSEGPALFMERTARRIEQWFRDTRVRPLHLRVLREVFKGAWKEKTLQGPSGTNYLRFAREERSRELWELAKSFYSAKRRRQEHIVHAGFGGRVEWEDVFVMYFCTGWREVRDKCTSGAEWLGV